MDYRGHAVDLRGEFVPLTDTSDEEEDDALTGDGVAGSGLYVADTRVPRAGGRPVGDVVPVAVQVGAESRPVAERSKKRRGGGDSLPPRRHRQKLRALP